MIKFFFEKLYFITLFLTSIAFIVLGLMIQGCTTKPQIIYKTKYIYIKPSYPELKTYEVNSSLKLHLINNKNKVFVKEWNCSLPKQKLIELIKYINQYKTNLNKCNNEIKIYNEFIKKQDNKK